MTLKEKKNLFIKLKMKLNLRILNKLNQVTVDTKLRMIKIVVILVDTELLMMKLFMVMYKKMRESQDLSSLMKRSIVMIL